MKEKLYTVKYLQHSVFSEAREITEEMTQKEIVDLLSRGMVTLKEATQLIKNGEPKYREVY